MEYVSQYGEGGKEQVRNFWLKPRDQNTQSRSLGRIAALITSEDKNFSTYGGHLGGSVG